MGSSGDAESNGRMIIYNEFNNVEEIVRGLT
jgi:hypothetical protein